MCPCFSGLSLILFCLFSVMRNTKLVFAAVHVASVWSLLQLALYAGIEMCATDVSVSSEVHSSSEIEVWTHKATYHLFYVSNPSSQVTSARG